MVPILSILIISILTQSVFAYYNLEHSFSITPPGGWIAEDQEGIIVVLFTSPSLFTKASINIAVEEIDGTFSQYIAASKEGIETMLNDYVLVTEGNRIIDGLDCYQIVSTYTIAAVEFKASQYIFFENGKAYVITCACSLPEYDNLLLDFEDCVATFGLGDSLETSDTSDTGDTNSDTNVLMIGGIVAVLVLVVVVLLVILFLKKKKLTDLF